MLAQHVRQWSCESSRRAGMSHGQDQPWLSPLAILACPVRHRHESWLSSWERSASARHGRSGSGRDSKPLVESPMLHGSLKNAGHSIDEAYSATHASHGKLLSICLVEPGVAYRNPLTVLTGSERMQWLYYACANDAYTVKVLQATTFREPIHPVRNQCSTRHNLPCLFSVTSANASEILESTVDLSDRQATCHDLLRKLGLPSDPIVHGILAVELLFPLAWAILSH